MLKRIKLTQGKFAIVDEEVYDYLNCFKWATLRMGSVYHAARNIATKNKDAGRQKTSYMHHWILGFPGKGMMVDHINGNGLDNRKKNLRIVSCRVNNCNNERRRNGKTSSRYMGVHWDKRDRKWRAKIRIKQREYLLGYFKNEKEAGEAYLTAFQAVENGIFSGQRRRRGK